MVLSLHIADPRTTVEGHGIYAATIKTDTRHPLEELRICSTRLNLEEEDGWRDVQVVGQFCGRRSIGCRAALMTLFGHAREVFTGQPTRLFLHGFFLYPGVVNGALGL